MIAKRYWRSAVWAVAAAAGTASLTVADPSAQSPADAGRTILGSSAFKQASAFVQKDQDRFLRELIVLTEIPAPPFKEAERATAYLEMLRQAGLSDVEMDTEGNAMGLRKGGSGPLLAVVAHVDTVFPPGTDVRVKRQGQRLLAPGIGDNTRGLALMLSMIRAMQAANIRTESDILFVGSVGEEGEGDLRGVRFLLQKGKYTDRITRFIAIDGGDSSVLTTGGVGSKRYRVTFNGPGGHSYGAFGLVNPAFALGSAIATFSKIQVPSTPKTTFNVGVVSGGTSVNSIPSDVSMDVDMRSESCAELKKVDDAFLAIVRQAVDDENRARSTREGRVQAEPRLIGDRPCGETPRTSPLVQAAAGVIEAAGLTPTYGFSSTDANLPMSMGIPAITIGRGGPGGRAHAPDEWTEVDPTGNARATEIALAIVLSAAGGGS